MQKPRLLTNFFSRYSTSSGKVQKIRIISILLVFTLCCIFGEILSFTLSSQSWTWPAPVPLPYYVKGASQKQDTMYFEHEGSHQYVLRPRSEKRTAGHEELSKNVELGFKIMLISDPHIMCTHNTKEWWLARWDADTYLKKSFSRLHSLLKPDLIVFVGDVFTAGFEANDQQWEDYLQCFQDIYSISSSEKLIVAMGDNDLGGEGHDLMTQTVYRRYVARFGELNNVFDVTENIRIVKITTTCFIRPPSTKAEIECRENLLHFLDTYKKSSESTKPPLTILVSHVPLNKLSSSNHYTENNKAVDIRTKILLTVAPDVVVSGHVHHEMYTQHRLDTREVYEITVPTCSYRMGKRHMGIGTAVVGESENMAYRVNWLPPRYPYLFGYGVLGLTLFVICVCLFFRLR